MDAAAAARPTHLRLLAAFLLCFALGTFAAPPRADDDDAPAPAPAASGDEAEAKPGKGPAEWKALKYRLVGPAVGGRVSRVSGVPGDPRTYWAATASGGVFKSEDGGVTWKPVFDDQPISSVGSIAVSPSHPDTVYVGSGEANIRGNAAAGNGIYKSTDGGKNWTQVFKQEGQVGTMVVHPTNPEIAFAAVLGHAFGPNPERGVYRTKDGGKSWQQVLKKDADTGASDVCMDPSNPNILFAGFWQARRTPWGLTSAGPGSGFWVTRDGGDTWKELTGSGLPDKPWGKVGCGVAPSNGERVYVLIEAEKGGLFRSDDGGESWSLATDHRAVRQRPWYYTTLTIDPANPDVIWFPQVPLLKSIDGGKTVARVKGPHHGDHHDVWIDPKDPKRMIDGNDGGVDLSWNGGQSWYTPPLPIAQFYHVAADDSDPYRVMGAMQDLGTASGPSNSLADGGINPGAWNDVGGGEAGWAVAVPNDPNTVYAGEYLGIITKYDATTGMSRNVSIYPENGSGHGAEAMRYRFQWTAPIATSPHDPKVIYHGGNVLFRTQDGGQTWAPISPDLTRNDKSKQGWSGGPITGDNTGAEYYCTIFVIAESPLEKGLIWTGSDDGLVHVTRDAGAHWSNVTGNVKGIPEWGTVSMIEPSPHDAATAYLVVDAHRSDDMRPYLWKTTDYGKSWKSLASSLPKDIYLHSVREDPEVKGLLYLGTERGVSVSRNDGGTWQVLGLNFPTVAVHDLIVKRGDLVVGTHGRSIWILDDLTPIRQWSKEVADKKVHLFPVRPAVRWEQSSSFHVDGPGENPPYGAIINYALKAKLDGDLKLDILDASGTVIRTWTSKKEDPERAEDDPDGGPRKKPVLANSAGVQRFVWDLETQGAKRLWQVRHEGNADAAPRVVPGIYTARLTAGGQVLSTPIEVRPDPRITVPLSDLQEQVRLSRQMQDQVARITGLVTQVRSVRDQLRAKMTALAGNERAADWIASAQKLIDQCDLVEGKLHNPKAQVEYDVLAKGAAIYSQVLPLLGNVVGGSGAPTQGMRDVFGDHQKVIDAIEVEWRALVSEQLPVLATKAAAIGASEVVLPGR
ncbi:MAG TPA: glycosyl hydrolase [Dongiaceae bacterium]|nr:glycosyl hydrolase [Dongiaceae bacterium]